MKRHETQYKKVNVLLLRREAHSIVLLQQIRCLRVEVPSTGFARGGAEVYVGLRIGTGHDVGILEATLSNLFILLQVGPDFQLELMWLLVRRGRAIFDVCSVFRRQVPFD